MHIAHKIELKLNNKQKTYFHNAFGVARFSYNWALSNWDTIYKNGGKPNVSDLAKQFNSIKKEQYPWVKQVSKYVTQKSFQHLEDGFDRFFKHKNQRPKLKKRGVCKNTFSIGGDLVKIKNGKLQVSKLGLVRLTEPPRFEGKISTATFSEKAGRYFVSIQVEVPGIEPTLNKGSIGVDLGIKSLAVTSDGHVVRALAPLKKDLRKLKRQQRSLTKKVLGSKNRTKQKLKVAKVHYKIANKRKDVLHKFTTFLVKNYSKISIEDLNVSGMTKNHSLARSISDVGFGEFRRQIEYKSKMRGVSLTKVNMFYPSSKTCSCCGEIKKDLSLSDRTFVCTCGLTLDRDLNAAININKIGRASPEFTPVEITALRKAVYPYFVTSIGEAGIEHHSNMSKFRRADEGSRK